MTLDPDLMAILVCPACRGDLEEKDDELVCKGKCQRRYPIVDGIPHLIVEEEKPK